MKIEYVLTTTDLSFDYGDFPGSCYGWTEKNGFYLDLSKNDVINIESLEPFGECIEAMRDIKTLEDLKRFLIENFEFFESQYKDVINELIYFINKNLKMEVKL